jgi:hypothetical protein
MGKGKGGGGRETKRERGKIKCTLCRRLRQENPEFEASMGSETLPQKKNKKTQKTLCLRRHRRVGFPYKAAKAKAGNRRT